MCVFISVGQTPRTGISGFYGKYVFKKKLPNSHISRVAIALYDASSNASLYSYWFLLLSDVLIVTTRVCVLWYHIVVYSAIASWHLRWTSFHMFIRHLRILLCKYPYTSFAHFKIDLLFLFNYKILHTDIYQIWLAHIFSQPVAYLFIFLMMFLKATII